MIACTDPGTHFPGIPADLPGVAVCLCCYTAALPVADVATQGEYHIYALRQLIRTMSGT
jgi:hypothetical protein